MDLHENNYFSESERKKLQKRKRAEKNEREKILIWEHKKAESREEEVTYERLRRLRSLLDAHVIDFWLIETTLAQNTTETEEIEAIFQKIDEIEDIDQWGKYLPYNMRITKKEYLNAINNEEWKEAGLKKIQKNLSHLSHFILPQNRSLFNIFSGYLFFLDKSLIRLQEYHIDIQDSIKTKYLASQKII